MFILEQQLFGELSSSDDEVGATINIIDEDEDSRLSVEDSLMVSAWTLNAVLTWAFFCRENIASEDKWVGVGKI